MPAAVRFLVLALVHAVIGSAQAQNATLVLGNCMLVVSPQAPGVIQSSCATAGELALREEVRLLREEVRAIRELSNPRPPSAPPLPLPPSLPPKKPPPAAPPTLLVPPPVNDGGRVIQLSGGRDMMCVLLSSPNEVRCWGKGGAGQMGNGATSASPAAGSLIPLGSGHGNVVQISAGGRFCCALFEDGQIKCWCDAKSIE